MWKKKSEEDRSDTPGDKNVSKRYRFNVICLESQIKQGLGDGTGFDNWVVTVVFWDGSFGTVGTETNASGEVGASLISNQIC